MTTDFANAHEGFSPREKVDVDLSKSFEGSLDLADSVIDVLNNEIGRTIGGQNSELGTIELATQILTTYRDEGLWAASQDEKGNIIISRSKISQEQFNAGIEMLNTLDKNGMNEADRNAIQNKNN